MPVSWQIGAFVVGGHVDVRQDDVSACDGLRARRLGRRPSIVIAARTSGGRLVEVWVISSSRLSARNSIKVSEALL